MSSAKRALQKVIRSWLAGASSAPHLLRHCETCGERSWHPLSETVRSIKIDARLPNGSRADALLMDAHDNVELVIQLDGSGSRLANRIDARAGFPLIVLRSAMLVNEPDRWWTSREHGLPGWRCRCTGTRTLHVDDDFSLRVRNCPIRLRSDGGQPYARVIEDCGRCAFFVGIGYVGADRRRVQLRCGFGAPPAEPRAPLVTLAPPPPEARRGIVAGT